MDGWRRRCAVVLPLLGVALAGCGGREVTFPEPAAVEPPAFQTRPDDLADSPQLDAVPERDTAGLPAEAGTAAAELLPEALAWVTSLDPKPTTFTRISIYDEDVYFTWRDPLVPGRSVSGSYYRDGRTYVSEPSFDDDEGYPLEGIDPAVPAELVDAIERRFPLVDVPSVDLRLGLSYGMGLVWYVELTDARGTLATVFADLDGTIVAVDGW